MVARVPRLVIWARAAGRCQFPGCNKLLIGDLISGNEDANFGFIAHIVAEKPNGPRGDPIRSPLLVDDPSNLMLLCAVHHKLIDVDELDQYPEQRLKEIKAAHEDRINIVGDIVPSRATHVLRYGAKIGSHESPVAFERVRTAVLPERYPADGRSIGIEILGSATGDAEDAFWQNEADNLRRQYELQVRPRLADRSIDHLSVFGLAPIPLLVQLGHLLGDITPANVFQLHREPQGWQWAEDGDRCEFVVERPARGGKTIALKLGLSATIVDDRIHAVVGGDAAIWSLTARAPGNDMMRYKEDLREFRRLIRQLYNEIKATASPGNVIHVFPAIPVSTAIELGRVRMPKADLPLLVYDQVKERGFVPRIRID